MDNTFNRKSSTRYVIHVMENNEILFRMFTDSSLLVHVLNDLHKEYDVIRVYSLANDYEEVEK